MGHDPYAPTPSALTLRTHVVAFGLRLTLAECNQVWSPWSLAPSPPPHGSVCQGCAAPA